MNVTPRHLVIAILSFGVAMSAHGQVPEQMPAAIRTDSQPSASPVLSVTPSSLRAASEVSNAVRLLRDFKETDVKFSVRDLMETLRDRRHEGWVLAAYPDPKTGSPLIGAGFTLDLPAREHPQRDPLNPLPFIEPSSSELWQAAGLEPDRLAKILDQYNDEFTRWNKRQFRAKIKTLDPQISDDEATLLLRVSAIQAIYNAKAYCRNFDQLTGSQQMALSQLVYQMGVNLGEFSQFLSLINTGSAASDFITAPLSPVPADASYWKSVQQSLIQSQWARLYRTRAIAVIAMLDPAYGQNPTASERQVGATLRPAVVHRRRGHVSATRQLASASTSRRAIHRKQSSRSKRRI